MLNKYRKCIYFGVPLSESNNTKYINSKYRFKEHVKYIKWCLINDRYGLKYPKKKNLERGFPGDPVVKNLPSNAGDAGSIPEWFKQDPTCCETT